MNPQKGSASSPAVSVIVPAYNVTQYIAQALESVFAQTFSNYEVIVVNDGCPDTAALERVLEPYQSRVSYIKKANGGVAAACNTAIRAARAPFFLHLDPDDWLEPDCLACQIETITAEPGFAAVYSNSTFAAENELKGKCWMDVYPSTGEVSFLSVMQGRTCPHKPGSIIRREFFLDIGLYDESLTSWEDFDLWLRILKAGGRIGYTPRPLVHYRVRGGSLTTQSIRYVENAIRVMEKVASTMTLGDDERQALLQRRASAQFDLENYRGKEAIGRRDWTAARRHFEYCLRQRPGAKLRLASMALKWCPYAVSGLMKLRKI